MAFRFLSPHRGPPPLPPKDEHYTRPLSPRPPSQFNESVVSESSSSVMSPSNKLSIASFLSRFPRSASSREGPNDDGISLPWNFQHHIHVDEGYVGLPPSWLTSTFTEEEIAQIQARRTAVLHGVGGGYHHQMRPPSPTSSLYPSVIQGHRRNKSSIDSAASSSTPNLVLPSQHPIPQSLSSTNLALLPSSPSVPPPLPLRPSSPAPTNASSTQLHLPPPLPPPTTPSASSFPLAPRNILSDLSSASSNIVGAVKSSGMRLLRVKRNLGRSGPSSPPSSFENSSTNRGRVHSRLSDETFFPPEIVSPDRATVGSRVVSPTNDLSPPPSGGPVAPVWELYTTSKTVPSTTTANPNQPHTRQRSMSSSVHSSRSSSRTSSTQRDASNPNRRPPSRSSSLSNTKNTNPNLARSLSRSRSLSPASAHPYSSASSSTPPLPSFQPPPAPSSSHPSPHRPPHLVTHSQSGSMSSLVSIPEASPAPGAVVPFPMPVMPPGGKGSLTRKSAKHGGANGYGPGSSRHHQQHYRNPSTGSTSAASHSQTNLTDAESSSSAHSHKYHGKNHHLKHQHTASTSSQQSTSSKSSTQSSTSQAHSSHSHAHSNSSSHSIATSSSSIKAHSNEHIPELPMLSLPRLSISLPFGEDSFFSGGFGTALGSTSTSTSTAGRTGELVPGAGEGGASWSGSTTSGSAFGSSLSRWFDNSETPTNASVGARSGTSASTNYASGSNGNNVASGSGSGRGLTASGSGNTNASGRLYDPPPPKLIPGSSSSTTTSTLTFPSTGHASSSTSHLASSSSHLVSTSTSTSSTSTPNLASTSTSNSNPTSTLTLPQNSNTSQIPIPTTSATPSRPRTSVSGKGSPPRRRPLPSSKPYPGYPVPALPLAPPSLKDAGAGITKLVPVPPTPFSPFATSARHLPSPLPVPPVSLPPMPPVASGSGSDPGSVNPSTIATASHLLPLPPPPPPPPPPPSAAALQQQQPSASLLSPPPVSAIFSPNGMLSPTSPLSAATSAAQSPNSAQLWSEIAHMMDPGMLSAIPGLHLSTALPEDARDAVRKAGETVGAGSEEDKTEEGGEGGAGKKEVALVGDLVGPSPPVSADLSGGVKEGSISRVEEGRERADKDGDEHEEDEDSESEEEYEDEESYDGVVQSVVVARPHPLPQAHSHSHPHLQSQPLPIPTIPCVIEPLRTVGRPRLVNVNANGLAGEEQARLKEASVERKGGDVDADVESNKLKISELSTQEKYRDSIRSSTTTIVPSGSRGVGDHAPLAAGVDEVNGQGGPSRTNERPHHHHRPPSMKLWISNGIEHHAASFAGNGMRAESSAMATMGTAEEEEEEEEGGEHASPFLNYYLEDVGGTPSPLPSPGSALGSPLRDDPMFDGESEGEGVRSGGSGLELEATPTSSFSAMYSSRRYGFENGHDGDEYGLSSRSDDAERVVAAGNRSEEPEDEDDFYVDSEEDEGGKKEGDKQARALPLTTPTIILNDGTHSPANDDDNNKTRTNKAPLNDAEPSSISSSVTDLTDTSLSLPPSPFQQRYCGWVSTLVAPLSEFIDEAVDPREHYLDLTEIAEGESGSVYAAKVNRSNAKKLRLGDVVRMQDSDDLGLGGNDDNDNDDNDRDNVIGNEKRTKLVAIKSIALVPNGTPKLVDLLRELNLMKGLWHFQVLSVDAVYVDLVEDSVWLRMELMERSLADVIVLVDRGLVLQERTIARFASDVLLALEFLLRHNIAHRDVRSDNMLINNQGVLKLADFTNAVRVDPTRPLHTDVVGVPFWQAPELLLHNNSATAASSSTTTPTKNNVPPYDPLKLDVWSLGSTVWEMAETVPPFFETGKFGDRWPPLSRPGLYSPAFHEFLRLCSEPAGSRPTAAELLQAHFINNACGRLVIVQLLTQCRTIERSLRERNDDPS